MKVEIDPNTGGEDYIMEIANERFLLVAFIPKATFTTTITRLKAMSAGGEVLLGTLGCGPRVWLIQDPRNYALGVGDTNSKDPCYSMPGETLAKICNARSRL